MAPPGRVPGNPTGMSCLMLRSVILACWLLALLVHGDASVATAAVATALIAVWVAPLIRDGRRREPV